MSIPRVTRKRSREIVEELAEEARSSNPNLVSAIFCEPGVYEMVMSLRPDEGINGKPFIMYKSIIGRDLYDQPFPNSHWSYGVDYSIGVSESLIESLAVLISATERLCGNHHIGWDNASSHCQPSNPFRWRQIVCRNLHALIFKGNKYFASRESFYYRDHRPNEEDKFCNLLNESRHTDDDFKRLLETMEDCNITHPSASALEENNPPAFMYYLERKLESQVPKTDLDIMIVANAYHAEVCLYWADLRPGRTSTFHFWQKGVYNYNLPDGKKRPEWVLVQDRTSNKWYAVTSRLRDDQSYLYVPDKWGSLLLERNDDHPIPMIN